MRSHANEVIGAIRPGRSPKGRGQPVSLGVDALLRRNRGQEIHKIQALRYQTGTWITPRLRRSSADPVGRGPRKHGRYYITT
ncbi:unnamed protein product [Ectocarpus fasciculatus]